MKVFSENNRAKILRVIPGLILLVGVFLRLKIYFQNRSLFIDEGALACEIVSKSFSELFLPLQYQFSPPIFSVAVKISTSILGANEYGLRLVSLMAGIVGLFLFYRLIKKQLTGISLICTLGLLSFSLYHLQYSTECKQYVVDVLATIVMLLLFFKYKDALKSTGNFIVAGIVGAFMVWCSMPGVFVLAGLGSYVFLKAVNSQNRNAIIGTMGMIACWLISFAIYYFRILKSDAAIDSLVNFHQEYFFPLIPRSGAELSRGINLLLNVLKTGVGAMAVALIPGLLFVLAGIYAFWKKEKMLCAALVLPFILCLFASGIEKYSLISRMILFLLPIQLLFLGQGIQLIQQKIPARLEFLFWLIAVITWIYLGSFQFFSKPYLVEEIRPVLSYVHEHQKENESAFVHHMSMTSFRFYQYFHEDKNQYAIQRALETKWNTSMKKAVAQQQFPCWVIISHLSDSERNEILAVFKKRGSVVDSLEATKAGAWLFAEN